MIKWFLLFCYIATCLSNVSANIPQKPAVSHKLPPPFAEQSEDEEKLGDSDKSNESIESKEKDDPKIENLYKNRLRPLNHSNYEVRVSVHERECIGGLLTSNLVVTSGYCLTTGFTSEDDFLTTSIGIVINTVNPDTGIENETYIRVTNFFVPNKFNENIDKFIAAIAILKLESSVKMIKNFSPTFLKLPHPIVNYTNDKIQNSIYGFDRFNYEFNYSDNKKIREPIPVMKLRLLEKDQCEFFFEIMRLVDPDLKTTMDHGNLCVGFVPKNKNKKNVCLPQSGGLLVTKNNDILGVLAIGEFMCRRPMAYGIYTNVLDNLQFFIDVKMNKINEENVYNEIVN